MRSSILKINLLNFDNFISCKQEEAVENYGLGLHTERNWYIRVINFQESQWNGHDH